MAAFIEKNCSVSIPYGDNSKYDFIADVNGRLLKIQVKTASKRDDESIKFSCRTTHVNCSGVRNVKYNSDDVDYFATYWNGICYLVPVNECSAEKTLRFGAPKNGQTKGICLAENYRLDYQLNNINNTLTA
jgi:hypothetical protein